MKRQFTEQERQMAFKHRKRVSASLKRNEHEIRKCYLEHFLLKNVNTEFGGYNSLPHTLLVVEYICSISMEANWVH